jgi:hypothetical protein
MIMEKTLMILGLVLTVVAGGCVQQSGPVACTADAKLCPDGSAVGRDSSNNCEFKPCPVNEKPDDNISVDNPYVQYVADSREKCAATDWICPGGSSQFFDDTGCGCKADEPKKYVGNSLEECSRIKFMCEKNYVYFSDDKGCGCEYSFDQASAEPTPPSMPPAPGKLQAIDCPAERPQACTKEYVPVCGWYSQDIQCIKYPCANVYGNKCMACADSQVAYYTEGQCPTDDGALR